ncbi:MAG: HAD family hydrolase [Pseudomonadota bacterium]
MNPPVDLTSNDIFIFDLDGTLVQSVEFDDVLYQEAVSEVVGTRNFDTDWESYRHVTDSGLLTELLARLGLEANLRVISEVRTLFTSKIRSHLESGGECQAVPGAIDAIGTLRQAGVPYGVATGGWGSTARLKLKFAGFDVPRFISSGDDSSSRTGIMRHCLRQIGGKGEQAVYFGDAVWDVKATQELGWRFVGIGDRVRPLAEVTLDDFKDSTWMDSVVAKH